MVVVGVCAVVDVAAGLTLATGANTVQKCGVDELLGLFELVAWFGFGIFPIGIALAAVGAAFLMPELRRPRLWLMSAALLTLLAVGVVTESHARFPQPSNPAWCDI